MNLKKRIAIKGVDESVQAPCKPVDSRGAIALDFLRYALYLPFKVMRNNPKLTLLVSSMLYLLYEYNLNNDGSNLPGAREVFRDNQTDVPVYSTSADWTTSKKLFDHNVFSSVIDEINRLCKGWHQTFMQCSVQDASSSSHTTRTFHVTPHFSEYVLNSGEDLSPEARELLGNVLNDSAKSNFSDMLTAYLFRLHHGEKDGFGGVHLDGPVADIFSVSLLSLYEKMLPKNAGTLVWPSEGLQQFGYCSGFTDDRMDRVDVDPTNSGNTMLSPGGYSCDYIGSKPFESSAGDFIHIDTSRTWHSEPFQMSPPNPRVLVQRYGKMKLNRFLPNIINNIMAVISVFTRLFLTFIQAYLKR